MGLNQPAVAAYQRLDANRLRPAEDAVPARAVLAVVSRGGDKYRPAVRVNALQQGAEIVAADVAGEPETGGSFANPAADTGLALGIVVVLTVMLIEVGFGLSSTQGAMRHTHHAHHSGTVDCGVFSPSWLVALILALGINAGCRFSRWRSGILMVVRSLPATHR